MGRNAIWLLFLLLAIVALSPIFPVAEAQEGMPTVVAPSLQNVVTLDGVFSGNEWDDAGKLSVTYAYDRGEPSPTHPGTIYLKHDETYLWICIQVQDDDENKFPEMYDYAAILFDANGDGDIGDGDDSAIIHHGLGPEDIRPNEGGWLPDTEFGGSNDVTGESGWAAGWYTYEMRKPLNSGDTNGYDIAISWGDTILCASSFWDAGEATGWAASAGSFYIVLDSLAPEVEEAPGVEEAPRVVRQTPSPESVGAAIVIGTATTVGFSAILRLPIPDSLKGLLSTYAEEAFQSLTEEEVKARRRKRLITKGDLLSLAFSSIVLLVVFAYVELNGLPNFLDVSLLIEVVPLILVSVVIVSLVTELFAVMIARALNVWSEFKIGLHGLAALLITGIVFLVPFAPIGKAEYQGDLDKRKSGLIGMMKILCILALNLPFYAFHVLGFTTVGDAGLLMAMMTACCFAFPFRPLEGEAIFRFSKISWIVVFASSFLLYLSIASKMLPYTVYLLSGLTATALFTALLLMSRRLETT